MDDLITETIARGWENFIARSTGPMNLRLFIQPIMATILAFRAGLKDARAGLTPYLWTVFTNSEARKAFLHDGWKDLRTPLLISLALDAIYQLVVHQSIFPVEMLFTATLLALVPYSILRGPINRLIRMFYAK